MILDLKLKICILVSTSVRSMGHRQEEENWLLKVSFLFNFDFYLPNFVVSLISRVSQMLTV